MVSRLDFALQIGTKAYQQEIDRGKVIALRADYLMKWVAIFVSVFNIAIPIIVKETQFDYHSCVFVFLYGTLMALLVIAMILLASVNFPKRIKHYPFGYEIINNEKEVLSEDDCDLDLEVVYKNVLMQDAITQRMKNNNDKAAIEILLANIAIILANVFLAITFVYLMLHV